MRQKAANKGSNLGISPVPTPWPMAGGQLGFAVFILSLATFIVILDATIINVAIPHIAGTFAASPSEGTWVITSYAVAEALTVPLSGWLVARFGIIRVLVTSLFGFSLFSVLCGIAPSLNALIFLRILQGLTGGPLIPISQTLILRISPPKQVEAVMGLWMMTSIIAPIAGPILGGTLADTLGWRWAFYLNVPIAIGCAVAAAITFRSYETKLRHDRIDYFGLVLLILWVSSLQIVLDTGPDQDWFASLRIRVYSLVGLISFISFVFWEVSEDFPIVDLRIFRHRGFIVSASAMFVAFGTFFASLILLPLWLQLGMGYTATLSGYALALQGSLGIFVAPLAAYLMPRVDARLLMSTGLGILSSAIFLRAFFSTNISFGDMVVPQLLMGIGLPLFFVPLMTLSLRAVNSDETASASGVLNFIRTIAAAISTAILVATWRNKTVLAHAQLVGITHFPPQPPNATSHFEFSIAQLAQLLDDSIWQQSMMLATNSTSIFLAALMAVVSLGIWVMPDLNAKAE